MSAELLSHTNHEFPSEWSLGYGNGHYIRHKNIFVYFGGQAGPEIKDNVFYIDLDFMKIHDVNVSSCSPQDYPPRSRGSHSFVLDDRYIWLISGFDRNWEAINTKYFYRLDVDTWSWKRYKANGSCPVGRAGGTLTPLKLEDQRQVYVLIGGNKGFQRTNDVHAFDLKEIGSKNNIDFNIQWIKTKPIKPIEYPQERSSHTAIEYDESTILMFGGWAGQIAFDDVWLLEFVPFPQYRWKQLKIQPSPKMSLPVKSSGHAMIHIGDHAIISGGFSNQSFQQSFYALNLKHLKWENINNPVFTHPVLAGHVMDKCGDSKILFYGGIDGVNWQSTLHICTFKNNFGREVEAMLPHGFG